MDQRFQIPLVWDEATPSITRQRGSVDHAYDLFWQISGGIQSTVKF